MRVDRDGQMWDLLDLDDGGDIDVWDKGNYFGASYDSSAYSSYSIYTSTAAYNANLGGYHYGSVSSGITNSGYYNAYGLFSVTDDMARLNNCLFDINKLEATHGLTKNKCKFKDFIKDIHKNGIHESIKYVENGGRYYIVDGHHRWAAAKHLKYKKVIATEVNLPYAGYKSYNDLHNWER